MPEHDLEKLLGGFAADTLTSEERRLLYRAALEDQQLFNSLADEQALKELLADPAVRRRLLHALNQGKTSEPGEACSWLDWLRRPAGLAFAGGLAAAALAVVLGAKIYQDSLRQRAPAVATEDTKAPASPMPAPPPASTPPPQRVQPERELTDTSAKAPPSGQREAEPPLARRGRAVPAKPQEPSRLDAGHDRKEALVKQDKTRDEVATSGKAAEDARAATDAEAPAQRPVQSPLSPQTPAAPAAASAGPPAASARALFYAASPAVAEPLSVTQQEPAASREAAKQKSEDRRTAEAATREKKRAERSIGLLGQLSTDTQPVQAPLGLRYSLLMAGPGGIDLEVDPSTAIGKDDAPRLTVQTNQDGYLAVYSPGSAGETPVRLFPLEGDGGVTGRKTLVISLAALFERQTEAKPARILIVFSRSPRDPHAPPPTQSSPALLTERVEPGRPDVPPEHAMYVVAPGPGRTDHLSIEVNLSVHP
ncbi:hypothetical protein [Nitrospira moscoviensis]|uniref:Uncharacterized protein n=1 Tax=Nitrospira moscoviensis TaxID=42253 RepID=A0A0K2G9F8_NITMO|nr:hypothetical protein [Nitrospira moscoviensis]ALA57489.1 hypothetical protein NITMOv2_1058 [Nitrospira moscoviensis]